MKIRILDEAISDLRLGAQFYEDQSAGLGTYFLDTLFSDIESLAQQCADLRFLVISHLHIVNNPENRWYSFVPLNRDERR